MKKIITVVFAVFFSVLLVISGWKVFDTLRDYKVGEETYESLVQYVSLPEPNLTADGASEEVSPTHSYDESAEVEAASWPTVDFEHLAQINPDIVGWILIEGTNISYPIVQGDDNDHYLTHLFDGTVNKSGSIFLDASASDDFSDRHSIVFGHNMKDDTMFSALLGYSEQEFYDAHMDALILTPECNFRIRLFSGYVAENDMNAWDRDLGQTDFENWLADIAGRSLFVPGQMPETDDSVVTFSTCTDYGQTKFVIHGFIAETSENQMQ